MSIAMVIPQAQSVASHPVALLYKPIHQPTLLVLFSNSEVQMIKALACIRDKVVMEEIHLKIHDPFSIHRTCQ
jgi:hypothetical protein